MKSIIQDMKQNYIINAIIMVVLGLILIIWSETIGNILCYILGGALVLMGVFQIIGFLRGERLGFYNKFNGIMGIVLILLGVWVCANPKKILSIIPVIIGIIMLIHGLMDVQYALDIKKSGAQKWWIALIAAVITLGLGIFLVLNPFIMYQMTMILIGLAMLYDGASDLVLLFCAHLAQKDTDRRVRDFKG